MLYNQVSNSTVLYITTPFEPSVLRQMRLRVNLSMETLALNAGLHDKAQVSRFERGVAVPLATTLGKLLQVLQPESSQLHALFNLPQAK